MVTEASAKARLLTTGAGISSGEGGDMMSLRVAIAVLVAPIASTGISKVPAALGVPDMMPEF